MRRLLYLAVVLVFLAMIGLAFFRVTSSPAYVARSRLARLEIGMRKAEARRVMADLPSAGQSGESQDTWRIAEGHRVEVFYLVWPPYDEPDSVRVWGVRIVEPGDAGTLARFLDQLGYEKSKGFGDWFGNSDAPQIGDLHGVPKKP